MDDLDGCNLDVRCLLLSDTTLQKRRAVGKLSHGLADSFLARDLLLSQLNNLEENVNAVSRERGQWLLSSNM
jgi:hypothetical protein